MKRKEIHRVQGEKSSVLNLLFTFLHPISSSKGRKKLFVLQETLNHSSEMLRGSYLSIQAKQVASSKFEKHFNPLKFREITRQFAIFKDLKTRHSDSIFTKLLPQISKKSFHVVIVFFWRF